MDKIIQLRDKKNKVYPKIKREFICVGLNQNIANIYDEYRMIAFDKILTSNTNKLTLENGMIRIGKNVKFIKIYFQCFCDRNASFGYIWAYSTINYQMICDDIVQGTINYSSHKGQSYILPVKENDRINLTINTTQSVRPVGVRARNNTFMVAEVIE